MISVVIPSYNEEENIAKTASAVAGAVKKCGARYEILFVDDGSKDGTWKAIRKASASDSSVRGIRFSRNFGKEAAILAGLAEAKGDCVTVMDCDLQHPPGVIPEMYHLWEAGYDVVEGIKRSRGHESRFHAFASACFYKAVSRASGVDLEHSSDFKLLDRRAVDALLSVNEENRFFRALSSWIGFESAAVEYDVCDRSEGESKWTTRGLVRYAVRSVASLTAAPMQIVTVIGAVLLAVSLLLGLCLLAAALSGAPVSAFTAVILMQCMTSGITMIGVGIVGYYIAGIHTETKNRPRYIVSDTTEQPGGTRSGGRRPVARKETEESHGR